MSRRSEKPPRPRAACGRDGDSDKREEVAEPADKPGSVVDSHSSRRTVTDTLEQPTRTRRGPRHEVPIWSCSRWGLPCRSVTGLAVRSYRTISPLPAPRHPAAVAERAWPMRRIANTLQQRQRGGEGRRRYLSVALSVGSRRPGVTWHLALWSPDFPRHPTAPKCAGMTRLSGRLRRAYCRMSANTMRLLRIYGQPCALAGPPHPPYNALRAAPVSSAASLAAVEGGRCSLSLA